MNSTFFVTHVISRVKDFSTPLLAHNIEVTKNIRLVGQVPCAPNE